MECLIETSNKQYKVAKDKIIYIDNKKDYKQGQEIVFDKILYVLDNGKLVLGKPFIKNAIVSGTIVDIVKGPKLQWIKYGKSSFRVKKGYRHKYAKVKIKEIKVSSS